MQSSTCFQCGPSGPWIPVAFGGPCSLHGASSAKGCKPVVPYGRVSGAARFNGLQHAGGNQQAVLSPLGFRLHTPRQNTPPPPPPPAGGHVHDTSQQQNHSNIETYLQKVSILVNTFSLPNLNRPGVLEPHTC